MNAKKDRIAETERVRERKRARVERGAGDVLEGLGDKDDEQVAVRHADASGGDIRENPARRGQHERHPRWDKLRKTVRFEQEAPNASISSDPYITLEHHVRYETPCRLGSVLVQKLCHVEDDERISALDIFHEKDGRENRCIGEVL